MSKPTVLWVEDNPDQIKGPLLLLRHEVANIEIIVVESTKAALLEIRNDSAPPPDVIVLDMMIPWEEDRDGKPDHDITYVMFRGGEFLATEIRGIERLKDIPIVFSSVVWIADDVLSRFAPAWFCRKINSLDLTSLIQSLLSLRQKLHQPTTSFGEKVVNALEIKPGAFGVKFDLKKLSGKP